MAAQVNKAPYLWLGGVALLVLAALIYFRAGGDRIDWKEDYLEESKEPYGTYVVHQLLHGYFPGRQFRDMDQKLSKALPPIASGNYVFVGGGMYLDSSDLSALLRFVKKGNNAFISTKTIPFELADEIFQDAFCEDDAWEDYYELYDSTAVFQLLNPSLREEGGFKFRYSRETGVSTYRWQYIDTSFICESEYADLSGLGTISGSMLNFIRVRYGKGNFLLHTAPIAFTNYSLLRESSVRYAEKAFSYLHTGNIYWDQHSRIPEDVARRRNEDNGQGHSLPEKGPLTYVLSQPPLAWAWYLSLALALLYLLFRARRQQRVIPVLEENANSSKEFISTIGRLYFLQQHHEKLSAQKLKLFLAFVRERYHLPTNELNEALSAQLSLVSGVGEAVVRQIIQYCREMNHLDASEETLIKIHLLLEQFYKGCK